MKIVIHSFLKGSTGSRLAADFAGLMPKYFRPPETADSGATSD